MPWSRPPRAFATCFRSFPSFDVLCTSLRTVPFPPDLFDNAPRTFVTPLNNVERYMGNACYGSIDERRTRTNERWNRERKRGDFVFVSRERRIVPSIKAGREGSVRIIRRRDSSWKISPLARATVLRVVPRRQSSKDN